MLLFLRGVWYDYGNGKQKGEIYESTHLIHCGSLL